MVVVVVACSSLVVVRHDHVTCLSLWSLSSGSLSFWSSSDSSTFTVREKREKSS